MLIIIALRFDILLTGFTIPVAPGMERTLSIEC